MVKNDLKIGLVEALVKLGRTATIVEVCKYVWNNYKSDLEKSGDLFYTWQYDIRWDATDLRKKGIMTDALDQKFGTWSLS